MSYDAKHVPRGLRPYEKFWCSHQRWLESQGYMLRPRYRKGWVPSWTAMTPDAHLLSREDSAYYDIGTIMDAIRISDNKHVMLKLISKLASPYEVDVELFFSCPPLAADPRNHCVPVYDVLQLPKRKDVELIVMPLLRRHDDPTFDTVGEVVECFRQIFEGIQFMHRHGVAHGDCTYLNFMMDATQMYPSGYHPARPWKSPDSKQEAKFLTRTQRPPRYYLVGFGKARRFEMVDGWPIEPPGGTIGGYLGEGSTANPRIPKSGTGSRPESGPGGKSAMATAIERIQRQLHAVDPFAHDVYCVGSTIKRWYLDAKDPPRRNLDFLRPLIVSMTSPQAHLRPSIDTVVMHFDALWRSLPLRLLRARTQFDEWEEEKFPAVKHWVRRVGYEVRGVHPVPGDKTRVLTRPASGMVGSWEFASASASGMGTESGIDTEMERESGYSYYFPSVEMGGVDANASASSALSGPIAGLVIMKQPSDVGQAAATGGAGGSAPPQYQPREEPPSDSRGPGVSRHLQESTEGTSVYVSARETSVSDSSSGSSTSRSNNTIREKGDILQLSMPETVPDISPVSTPVLEGCMSPLDDLHVHPVGSVVDSGVDVEDVPTTPRAVPVGNDKGEQTPVPWRTEEVPACDLDDVVRGGASAGETPEPWQGIDADDLIRPSDSISQRVVSYDSIRAQRNSLGQSQLHRLPKSLAKILDSQVPAREPNESPPSSYRPGSRPKAISGPQGRADVIQSQESHFVSKTLASLGLESGNVVLKSRQDVHTQSPPGGVLRKLSKTRRPSTADKERVSWWKENVK